MVFTQDWITNIGDGYCATGIYDETIRGTGSCVIKTYAENKVHTAIPTSPLSHGLVSARYRFLVNIKAGTGTGSATYLRAGLCFMCSAQNMLTGLHNFYYTGVRLNPDTGGSHFFYLRKVIGGTLYDTGTLLTSAVVGGQTGFNKTYAMEVFWAVKGSAVDIVIKKGLQQDFSDLATIISLSDTSGHIVSTNEMFFVRSETGVTSATALFDHLEVSQSL
jgi:hypothetical protein